MTTRPLPLGPAAWAMISQLIKWQDELSEIHGDMMSAILIQDFETIVKLNKRQRLLDDKMARHLDQVNDYYLAAERKRRKGGAKGDDIYFFNGVDDSGG